MSPLVLLLAEADPVPEEERGKGNPCSLRSSNGSKIVHALLTDVVAVYVGLSAIYVRGTGLQLLSGSLGDDGSWDGSGSGRCGAVAEARAGAAAETGARASRTALKILCKSSSEYLGTLVAVTRVSAIGGFVPKGPTCWLNNLSPDSGGREKSGGATEGHSQQGHPRPWTEVILELISSKNTLPNGLADPLGMQKLQLSKEGCSYQGLVTCRLGHVQVWSPATPGMLSVIW